MVPSPPAATVTVIVDVLIKFSCLPESVEPPFEETLTVFAAEFATPYAFRALVLAVLAPPYAFNALVFAVFAAV